ncbi:hypothetical protein [Actinacidiphila oryziradicis]|uniref:Uncharacterized protein n=1 Tax=Actinacidiphila oryziradicis TaxID=2571141 RepID=A0A4U0RW42_9ACTN|nr:hypothetical protein [Actinacidiphila oryziradicis]TKA00496.1 hypothetical protein FCI23_42635 [Actinacidiphila oryziradicis]
MDAETAGVSDLAAALGVLRRVDGGETVVDADVLAAHDLLYASVLRHRDSGCMRRLAEVLVSRGVVPKPWDYDGEWWLWWPKTGRGPCRDCGKPRSLTRFSARVGKEYRYLCARCRAAERDHDAQTAEQLWATLGTLSQPKGQAVADRAPSPQAGSDGAQAASTRDETSGRPSAEEWDRYVERLHELLASLEWAGFDLPESWDSDWDPQTGALLFSETWRGDGCVVAEYRPGEGVLALRPFDDVMGDWPESYSLLDTSLEVAVAAAGQDEVTAVAHAAGEAGLLDATHVCVADSAPQDAKDEFAIRRIRRIFQPAADYRQLPLSDVLREITENEWLSAYLDMVVGMVGQDVAPDIVPDAAALGVAAWCWRNDTAVEAHHLETDVLMARVNMTVTRVTQQHVCPVEGIDWYGIEAALMDPQWALPDGTAIRSLFGNGWAEVASTVSAELKRWRQIDHEILGPDTTLILMSIGGSTSYTDSWWGQRRWRSICWRIVEDALTAGFTLPHPYNDRGAHALIADLDHPDLVSDSVLDWLIDLPEAGVDGPRGLRFNTVTRPLQRCWDPYWLAESQP